MCKIRNVIHGCKFNRWPWNRKRMATKECIRVKNASTDLCSVGRKILHPRCAETTNDQRAPKSIPFTFKLVENPEEPSARVCLPEWHCRLEIGGWKKRQSCGFTSRRNPHIAHSHVQSVRRSTQPMVEEWWYNTKKVAKHFHIKPLHMAQTLKSSTWENTSNRSDLCVLISSHIHP